MPALGTLVELSACCRSDAKFEHIAERAFARVMDFHRAMSFHDRDSDVRAIARARGGERLTIAADTWRVLEAALALEAESEGCFDVAMAYALVERGLLPRPDGAPIPASERDTRSAGAALALEPNRRVHVLRPVWIDLGGIAKGAAVDAALAAAREAGAEAAVVNAGGDLAVFGDEDRLIEVVGPRRQRIQVGRLGDGAVATSGPFGTASATALVVGRGLAPVWADRAVTVVAPSCLIADALTKVVAVRGPGAAALLARHAAIGFSIDDHGRLHTVGDAR